MAERRPKTERRTSISSGRLELLITIVNRGKADFYMDLIQSFEVNMQCVAIAEGTADAEMMNLLGLADLEKAVIFSAVREDRAAEALRAIEEKFSTIKDGKGIAYTVSMSSVIGVSIYAFLANNQMMASAAQTQIKEK